MVGQTGSKWLNITYHGTKKHKFWVQSFSFIILKIPHSTPFIKGEFKLPRDEKC